MKLRTTITNAILAAGWLIGALTSSAQTLVLSGPEADFSITADSPNVPVPGHLTVAELHGTNVQFKLAKIEPSPENPIPDAPNYLIVSPIAGVTPANILIGLNPNVTERLPNGRYQLNLTFETVSSSPSSTAFIVVLDVSPPSPPTVNSVLSAASLLHNISPGEIVSILGANIGTQPIAGQYDYTGLFPATLGNTTVTFNGTAAPLLYVSTGQINAVVPYEVAGQKTVSVVVTHDSVASPAFSLPLTPTSPAIFTVTQNGKGQGAILNDDPNVNPTPNSEENPAAKGIPISIYVTGGGLLSQTVQDGSIPLVIAEPPYFNIAAPVSVKIGGQPAKVIYAGAIPYQVTGMQQVNAIVPTNIGSGPQPVVLTIGDNNNAAQQVTVAVK